MTSPADAVPPGLMPYHWLRDRRIVALSDSAYRLFMTGVGWSVANRSEGVLDNLDIQLMPYLGTLDADATELIAAGLWAPRDDGSWLITVFASTQHGATLLEVRERKLDRDRRRKARSSSGIDQKVFDRDGNKCVHCGVTNNLTVDHIIPQFHGGGDEMENLQTLCGTCNSRKGHSLPADRS